jgi:hypothetical protein
VVSLACTDFPSILQFAHHRMGYSEHAKATRKLTVFAQDPKVRINGKILTAQVVIPSEVLDPGPSGFRVKVIDYDSTLDRFIKPTSQVLGDLFEKKNPNKLVDDPHFHTQNVYAIVMSTLDRFERALGRRVGWGLAVHTN